MRLLIDITAHGWGHLSQTAAVLPAIRQNIPDVELVVRSGLPVERLREQFGVDPTYVSSDTDFGVLNRGPFSVDRQATLERYRALHDNLDARIDEVAALVARTRCDAVLANVSYLAVAAARRAGVPGLAWSSINWADLFESYCGNLPGFEPIHADMLRAYREATAFFRLLPGMPMRQLDTIEIPQPIARVGRDRRRELAKELGIGRERKIVLCAFASMLAPEAPPIADRGERFVVIGPGSWRGSATVPIDRLPWPFADLLASADVVLSKPGYSIVAELACRAKHAVLATRNDWPEERYLVEWLRRYSRCSLVRRLDEVDEALLMALFDDGGGAPAEPPRPDGGGCLAAAICAQLARHA